MIVARNVFQLKFGKAKEAKAAAKEGAAILEAAGIKGSRALMDVSGAFYTLVLEIPAESLGAYEKAHAQIAKDEKWQKWYAGFIPLIESGSREIYSIVE
jgi:hypothetical protein